MKRSALRCLVNQTRGKAQCLNLFPGGNGIIRLRFLKKHCNNKSDLIDGLFNETLTMSVNQFSFIMHCLGKSALEVAVRWVSYFRAHQPGALCWQQK